MNLNPVNISGVCSLWLKTLNGFLLSTLSRPYLASGKDEDLHFLFLFYSSPLFWWGLSTDSVASPNTGHVSVALSWQTSPPEAIARCLALLFPLRTRDNFLFSPLLVAAEIILPEGGDVLNRRPMLRYACYQTGNDVTVAAAPSGAAASRR
ncbi:hypothetical protein TNIN_437951 [Trichonephila inaurata madagascariensis]|uniref:Uncharacterized protein n=1 Tax=Trichonephila inaurata madagascariensis TaxID=2747483 RepID=A0A8X6XD11_9ARAC|nr:hypothetical protein TNIN_437951 [Trichonephila inaurata madagascariensis]